MDQEAGHVVEDEAADPKRQKQNRKCEPKNAHTSSRDSRVLVRIWTQLGFRSNGEGDKLS
jgi:hypothetical protein